MKKSRLALMLILGVLMVAAGTASAQPFTAYMTKGAGHGFVEIPHSSAFDFTNGFTFEAWVNGSDSGGCSSIAGKTWTQAWWIGVCGTTLRSYIKGTPSLFDGGVVPANEWTHIAVTFDGTTRNHYIDGELVATRADSGPMVTSTSALRLDSDVAFQFSYGSLDEVRLWNVARTQAEIRSTITSTINSVQPGLVAVYHLDGSPNDSIGGHNGLTGGTAAYTTLAPVLCVSSATVVCFESNRFAVSSRWMTPGGETGVGTVVPGASTNSALFWFFSADNWELMVKELNGCGVNARRWVFSAATTNVHYKLSVTDGATGAVKRYFNYQNVSAPAVNDTGAFFCP
jgi:concanavalin A-like lectin/glucanase superfamily protein